MDKGIIFSIIIAAIVSISAAMFWDKLIDTPKQEKKEDVKESFKKNVKPNKETVKMDVLHDPDVITSPYDNKSPKKSVKPDREPKPTTNNPVRPNSGNTDNTGDTEVTTTNSVKTHIVQNGESLSKISKKYYKTEKYWPYIQKYNHLPNEKIDIGQKLLIPTKPQD